jgi:hypothetical protein
MLHIDEGGSLKICMVARTTLKHSRGGMQEDLQMLAEGAVKAGHRVVVITTRHLHDVSQSETRGVEIHYLQDTIPEFYMERFSCSTVRVQATFDHGDGEL